MNHQKRKTRSAHNKPRPGETSIRPETTNSFNDHTSITSWMTRTGNYISASGPECWSRYYPSWALSYPIVSQKIYKKAANFVFECKSWSLSLVSGNQGCTDYHRSFGVKSVPQTESLGIILLGMLPWKNTRVDSSFIFGWMKRSVMKEVINGFLNSHARW